MKTPPPTSSPPIGKESAQGASINAAGLNADDIAALALRYKKVYHPPGAW